MITFATRDLAVKMLLGPEAMVFEERSGWVIGVCTNRQAGPPYQIDVYGEGGTFEVAFEQARAFVLTLRG